MTPRSRSRCECGFRAQFFHVMRASNPFSRDIEEVYLGEGGTEADVLPVQTPSSTASASPAGAVDIPTISGPTISGPNVEGMARVYHDMAQNARNN